MLTMHLLNLCENPHPHKYVHTHTYNLTATSPVSRSLIKLTGAGPSGQANTSEPSPSCHDMMDLSSTGCQAATQVHCPVGLHQQTLGRHPVDLICIYTPLLHVEGSIKIGSASSPTLSACEWMYVYVPPMVKLIVYTSIAWFQTSGAGCTNSVCTSSLAK